MHQIAIDKEQLFSRFEREAPLQVRNNREHLIEQIVNATNEKNKKHLAKLIAIYANRYHWTDTEFHALLKKREDPSIRNYTAFVRWSIKDKINDTK